MDIFNLTVIEMMLTFYLLMFLPYIVIFIFTRKKRHTSGKYNNYRYNRRSYKTGYSNNYDNDSGNYYNVSNHNININDNYSSGYNAVQDSFDYPSQDGPLYDPYENQLYDNCNGGWDG